MYYYYYQSEVEKKLWVLVISRSKKKSHKQHSSRKRKEVASNGELNVAPHKHKNTQLSVGWLYAFKKRNKLKCCSTSIRIHTPSAPSRAYQKQYAFVLQPIVYAFSCPWKEHTLMWKETLIMHCTTRLCSNRWWLKERWRLTEWRIIEAWPLHCSEVFTLKKVEPVPSLNLPWVPWAFGLELALPDGTNSRTLGPVEAVSLIVIF